jgi:hypothetical protein
VNHSIKSRLIVAAAAACGLLAQASPARAAGYWEYDWENAGLASDLINPTRVNYSYAPLTVNANNSTLLLFLPGTGMTPSQYQGFMQEAVNKGYYVIGLDYVNSEHEYDLCGCASACYGALWEQTVDAQGGYVGFFSDVYTGLGLSETNSVISGHNSIGNRLYLFLNHLQANQYTGESADWAQFIGATETNWAQVVVAGHSRGSDIAAWMRINKGVRAALGFSALNNWLDTTASTSCDTPAAYRQSGVHCADGTTGTNTCTGTDAAPGWEPAPRSTPYPHLYLFDSAGDGNFDPTMPYRADQQANAVRFGWNGVGASHSEDVVATCPSSYTSSWIVDDSAGSSHDSTVVDGVSSGLSRTCVWDRMLLCAESGSSCP